MSSPGRPDPPPLVPLAKAIEATPLDSHVYAVNLDKSFRVGTVPNGGYVSATLLQAAHNHLAARNQPDTISVHIEFLNRTEAGPAIILVEDVKLGRQLSVLHLTLYQHGLLPHAPWITPGVSRKELVAYATNGAIAAEQGISLPTSFLPLAPPVQPVDLAALSSHGEDAHWRRVVLQHGTPFGSIRALRNMEHYAPKAPRGRDTIDQWIRLAAGGGFTNAALAYVVDAWPFAVEQYRPAAGEAGGPFPWDQVFWYPTVTLAIEVKKALPPAGEEWLFTRARTRMVRNGRFDLEVVVLDARGDLVALAQHVNLIVDAARNTAGRLPPRPDGKL